MKKLAKNVPLCTAILIVVAILAVPLLGGLKLSRAVKGAENRFEQILSTPLAANNKDINSDAKKVINAARTLLDKGSRLSNGSTVIEERGTSLLEAIEACDGAKTGVEKYLTCEALDSAIELYYNAFNAEGRAELETDKLRADSAYHLIKNTYRQAYAAYRQTTTELVSGFPASQIAGLFGIGGGK